MNHALNEANDLQRRIDALHTERAALKPEPIDEKLQARADAAMKEANSLFEQYERAAEKVRKLDQLVNNAQREANNQRTAAVDDLSTQLAALCTARNALLRSIGQ